MDDVKAIEAEPFEAFTVHPASVAVYHLGKSGSARQKLKEWTLSYGSVAGKLGRLKPTRCRSPGYH